MKNFAVAYWSNYIDLKIEIIEGEDWKDALYKHSSLIKEWEGEVILSDDIELAKDDAISADFEFDVKEII